MPSMRRFAAWSVLPPAKSSNACSGANDVLGDELRELGEDRLEVHLPVA
jgi:hypothetical protein